jgi:hypothetical protein
MIVRHRMQYFPEGGGAICPVITPTEPDGMAYAAGMPDGESGTCVGTPAGGGGVNGTLGGAGMGTRSGAGGAESTCGSVKPHFAQNSIPSGEISPQWRQTGTAGARLILYITVR